MSLILYQLLLRGTDGLLIFRVHKVNVAIETSGVVNLNDYLFLHLQSGLFPKACQKYTL